MSDLAAGVRYLGRGQRWVLQHGRWLGFGLLPALLTLALYAAALGTLGFFTPDLADWFSSWAAGWGAPWRDVFGTGLVVLLWGLALALAVVGFAGVTLLLGDPFYERLSEQVEEQAGGCPPGPGLPWWRELWNSLRDSLHVLCRAALFAVPLFLLGLTPVAGQTVVPVLGLCVSGYFLTLELTQVAMQRRGIPVREQLRLLRQRKGLALGFGVPLALCFLVPLLAVALMPGAVAGAALLVREVTGEDTDAGGRLQQGAQAHSFTPPTTG